MQGIRRRTFLGLAGASVAAGAWADPPPDKAAADAEALKALKALQDYHAQNLKTRALVADLLKKFPFKVEMVDGKDALATLARINASPNERGASLGEDFATELTCEYYAGSHRRLDGTTAARDGILIRAKGLSWPTATNVWRSIRRDAAMADLAQNSKNVPAATVAENRAFYEQLLADPPEAPVGKWPDAAIDGFPAGSTLRSEVDQSAYAEKLYVAHFPTSDWTEIPAHLAYGDTTYCPAAEVHIVMFRHLRDAYGAELISLTPTTAEVRVKSKPKTREEAMTLAKSFYEYCPSLMQAADDLSTLAAALMVSEWWYFYWPRTGI